MFLHKTIRIASALAITALWAVATSCEKREGQPAEEARTVFDVSIDGTRTSLGPLSEGVRKVYWSLGDRLSLNGTPSEALGEEYDGKQSARFTFPGKIDPPYRLLYPAAFWKDTETITLPSGQTFAEGSFACDSSPVAGIAEGGDICLKHLCPVVRISVRKDPSVSASSLASITLKGNAGEQLSGDFSIDYSRAAVSPAGGGGDEIVMQVGRPLREEESLDICLVVPPLHFESGFSVILEDDKARRMTKKSSEITLTPGKLFGMKEFSFVPSALAGEFTIDDIVEEVLPPDGYNVTGKVVDADGSPLTGVVVSDGLNCVRTMSDGSFYLESDLAKATFVHVSTPSGYMSEVSGGIPKFYKAFSDVTPSGGIYDFGRFTLSPMDHPDRFTLLVSADPQPRAGSWTLDNIAYHSLDICQDYYQELYDVAHSITDRKVFGICLGDLVHDNMDLLDTYAQRLSLLGYPTYNVIGNHDNDLSRSDDDASAWKFESLFGPRNYSFNLGGIHFVMLDNLIMKDNGEGKLSAYDQGLTDDVWQWLQADMAYVPLTATVMVCAHSPMFKQQSGSERTNTARHGGHTNTSEGGAYGYGDLFDKYAKVHAWAGHTHSSFNFIYSSSHRHKNVEVHTLARSTGELFTNEYLANGTPRGFTVVEVDQGSIRWKFHPITRQRGKFVGVTSGYCAAGAPPYEWRSWDYDSGGKAVMRDSGNLGESYQMNVYPRGSYGDGYVYANVFLWDEKWELPVWTPEGGPPVAMTRIYTADNHSIISDVENVYDKADTEFRSWYKTYANKSGGSLADLDGYTTVASDRITTLFRAPAGASVSSGTVSVTDRFGRTYSRTINW